MCLTFTPLPTASAATVITENKTGTEDGYAYELWKDNGNTSMTLTGGGTFSCEWSNINNCLFRKGKKYDCTQTYEELGNITIEYGVDYQPNGNSYMCVYGWTRNPLVEYYIVETWGSWRPPGATSALGTVYADGGTYDIYKTVRENQPPLTEIPPLISTGACGSPSPLQTVPRSRARSPFPSISRRGSRWA